MSTPRRRRRDREPLPQIVEHLAIEPTHEDTARRAYELFEDRGGEHGHDWEDWLQAERELREQGVVGVVGRILAMGGPYAAA